MFIFHKVSPVTRDATRAAKVKTVIFSRGQYTQKVQHTTVLNAPVISRISRKHTESSRRQQHGEQCLPFLCRARPMNRGSRPKRRYYYFADKLQVVKQSVTSTPSFVSLSISFIFVRAVGVCPSTVRRHNAFFRQCLKRYSYRHDDLKSGT